MLTLVKFDLINRLKKPMTWFMILIICILIGINFVEVQEEHTTRPFTGNNTIGFQDTDFKWSEFFITDQEKLAYPIAYESLKLYDEINIDALKANLENDYREAIRLSSFWSLIRLKMDRLTMDPVSDIMLKDDIYEMWVDVSNGILYDSVDFRPVLSTMSAGNTHHLLSAKYYHNLYINDFEPIYNDEINNLTAVYNYFLKTVPTIAFLIIILFTYNNINKDKNNGTLKLILTQSVNRGTYYISKWISSVLHILTILFIPPTLMNIMAGFWGGFINFKYPVFHLNNIFTRISPIPNYFDSVKREFGAPELHQRVFGHIAPSYYDQDMLPHKDIDIIPLYKYLLMVIILLILFTMFVVAFAQLISTIINNEIIGLITSSLLVGIFIYIGWPFTQERAYNLNPFTFFNVSRIVEGTYNVTFLTSALIMIISTILLLIFGRRHFNKKEI